MWRDVRDSQRQRVYKSECSVKHLSPRFSSFDEVKQFVRKVEKSEWIRSNFPWMCDAPHIWVIDSTACIRATATVWKHSIKIPEWARCELVVLHEICHLLMGDNLKIASHGPEYVQCYLKVVKHFCGPIMHDALKRSFKAYGVRVKPKSKRILTEEQKQVLRDRIAKAREQKQLRIAQSQDTRDMLSLVEQQKAARQNIFQNAI